MTQGTGIRIILIGYGPVASYKYVRFIIEGIKSGRVSAYAVVDLKSRQPDIEASLPAAEIAPEETLYLNDAEVRDGDGGPPAAFTRWLEAYRSRHGGRTGALIATEAKAHESYLRHCIASGVDTITTKPIVLPLDQGRFDAGQLLGRTERIARLARDHGGRHAVLCLGRHHDVYDAALRARVLAVMNETRVPVTSMHLHNGGGVWNLPREFGTREDHPYKDGYGMLMHGAYHYVDMLAQYLLLNRRVYPHEQFEVSVTAVSATPADQDCRIPASLSRRLHGFDPDSLTMTDDPQRYGETDVVGMFRLSLPGRGQTLTLGTFGFEQTTPGMRSWGPFPEVPYNINGRLHVTDVHLRLATAYSAAARVLKMPVGARHSDADLRARNVGRCTYRSNAALLGHEDFFTEEEMQRPHRRSWSYSAEKEIFDRWVDGRETCSDVESHLPAAALMQAVGQSASAGGKEMSFPFDYPEPEWPQR